jgi:DNA-binding MarR family transcriptional regulator
MTTYEQDILVYLFNERESPYLPIIEKLQIAPGVFRRAIQELITDGLVESKAVPNKNYLCYYLLVDGTALAGRIIRYRSLVGEIVKPQQINKMIGHYTPTTTYQRNNGNKHIQSRGL